MLAIVAMTKPHPEKYVPLFMILTYFVFHLAFATLMVKGNKPRYAISIEFWYIIVIAIGLFVTYSVIQKLIKIKNRWAVWEAILLLFWNIPNSISPAFHVTSGYAPITGEYHADISPAYKYIKSRSGNDDVFVTTGLINKYFEWEGDLGFRKVLEYEYNKPDSNEVIFEAIKTYSHGWVVLDYRRGFLLSQPIQLEDFIYENKQVVFLGWFGDCYILHWSEGDFIKASY
jgi:hypothetical protein